MIASVKSERNRPLVGQNLVEIGARLEVDPVEALLRLVDEEETAVSYVGHGMSPENVEQVLRHPLLMIGSDGSTMAPTGRALETRPHPRSYGTCPRVLGHYVRERRPSGPGAAVRLGAPGGPPRPPRYACDAPIRGRSASPPAQTAR